MSRRDARDVAFKLIFAYTFDCEKNVEALEEYTIDSVADDKAYVSEVYNGVILHYDELMEDIKNNAEKFDISRIFKIDLAVILLALYEIKYMIKFIYFFNCIFRVYICAKPPNSICFKSNLFIQYVTKALWQA